MSHIASQLLSFPDELLLMIFKQLDNIDVLYSLMGLDKHLDAIIRDPCFTTVLTLMKSNDDIERDQNEIFLDRFCFDIIPKIHHLIEWLKLDSTTMERILQVADYPNLWQLDIFIANEDPILNFNGELNFVSSSEDFRPGLIVMRDYRCTVIQRCVLSSLCFTRSSQRSRCFL